MTPIIHRLVKYHWNQDDTHVFITTASDLEIPGADPVIIDGFTKLSKNNTLDAATTNDITTTHKEKVTGTLHHEDQEYQIIEHSEHWTPHNPAQEHEWHCKPKSTHSD
jgi:hypothetical protein